MRRYRLYKVGRDGRFCGVEIIECRDDQEAIEQAKQAAKGRDVELWDRDRFIVRLSL
jgi:hypothetical protein